MSPRAWAYGLLFTATITAAVTVIAVMFRIAATIHMGGTP